MFLAIGVQYVTEDVVCLLFVTFSHFAAMLALMTVFEGLRRA